MPKSEQAAELRKLGLAKEALRHLQSLPEGCDVFFETALWHAQQWDYAAAAESLLKLLAHDPSKYESLKARAHLTSALTCLGALDSAEKWLAELEHDCSAKFPSLTARIQIGRGQFSNAKKSLMQAGAAPMVAQKWRQIVMLHEQPTLANIRKADEYRAAARKAGKWEILRGFDWEVAKVLNDPHLAARVFFGSPYKALQREILSSPLGNHLPSHVLRTDARWRGQNPRLVNPMTGENIPFETGSLPHRAVVVMLSDYYRPWPVHRLFDGLFGDETFIASSSPQRMQQVLEDVRQGIARENIPLELRSSVHGFRLRPVNEGIVISSSKAA